MIDSIENVSASISLDGASRPDHRGQFMTDVGSRISRDGSINKGNFEQIFLKNTPQGMSRDAAIKKADEVFATMDSGKNGRIDQAEFQTFQAAHQPGGHPAPILNTVPVEEMLENKRHGIGRHYSAKA